MTLSRPRIVVATSGSGASRNATETAARLASAFEAELTIVHVAPAVEYRVGRLASTLPIARQLDDPYASLVLLDARRLALAKGATARPVLIAGEAPQAVVAVAGRLVADLLVLGARRRRWPTSARAATRRWIEAHAPCPVLVVPAEELSPTPVVSEPIPVASWARNELASCCCGMSPEAAGAVTLSDAQPLRRPEERAVRFLSCVRSCAWLLTERV
jgi:nucleotide-binding universal stress UspA family protein